MKSKKTARLRRAQRGRAKMRELLVPRLSVYRSPRHIYAQVISEDSGYKYHGRIKALADAAREGGLEF